MENLVTEYHQITFDEYLAAKQEIKEELLNMAGSFIRIGYRLKQIKQSEAYRNDGYHTLAEFARAEYGLSESVTSRFIAINTKFSIDGNSPELLPEFENFGSGKLSEMLTLSDEDCRLVKETTTVATIRELKKFNKDSKKENVEADVVTETGKTGEKPAQTKEKPENQTEEISGLPLATSQEWTGIKQVIVEFFRDKKELLDDIYELGNCEDIAERMNPSGNLTFKKGLHMLFFYPYPEGVALKTFRQPNETYTWQEFVGLMAEVFGTAYTTPGKIWEDFYGAETAQEESRQEDYEAEKIHGKAETAQGKPIKTKNLETCDVARTKNHRSPGKNKETPDFQEEKEKEKTEKNDEGPKQVLETSGLEGIEGQAEIEDYFDQNGNYQIPEKEAEEAVHKKDNPKLFIRSLAGGVRLYSDNVEIARGGCIDEIIWQIESEISTMAADGYDAEIIFSRED